jgi:hypothetical protein
MDPKKGTWNDGNLWVHGSFFKGRKEGKTNAFSDR